MPILLKIKRCIALDIVDKNIDNGNAFDWGRVSAEYAKYRDIYPQKFYDQIVDRGLCVKGQKILDIGTGTGVIPRNMYRYGGEWVVQIFQKSKLVRLVYYQKV